MNSAGDVVLLIADSQIDALSRLRESLKRAAPGCRVLCAEGGRNAIDCARTTAPDAVLADMRLSDMSGLGLLLKIKAKHPDVVTIMMSDCGSQEARRMCLQAGVDFFFEKPLDVNRLIGMLGTSDAAEECVFRGTLDNLSVPDVLQLIICRPSAMVMEIDSPQGKGRIEIENGQVIHARVNGRVGEEAFYEMVGWCEGCFEVTDRSTVDERTIAVPLPQLLLTAAKRSENDDRLNQASEAVQESYAPFFPVEETAHEASYVWAPMANYARPPVGRPKRSGHSANWSNTVKVPRISAFRPQPETSAPLRVCKNDPPQTRLSSRPPASAPSDPSRRRLRSLLPGPRRIAVAAAAAVCVVLAGIRFFDVLSPQYARNVAPMLNGLFEKSAPPQSLTDAPARPEGGRPGGAADARSESADSPLEASESVPVLDLGVRREGPGAAPAYAVSVSRNRKLTGSSNLIGVSPALFQELGLRTNPWLRLVGPAGKTIGVLATEMPNAATPIVLSPEIHDALSHGRTTLSYVKTRPVYWSREGAAAALDFQAPRALDSEYCEYWYSVGLSLPSMLELGLTPGAYAVVHGPEGTQSVRVQLVDRGQSTEVWLSEPVREAVGAGRQDATIRVFPKS